MMRSSKELLLRIAFVLSAATCVTDRIHWTDSPL